MVASPPQQSPNQTVNSCRPNSTSEVVSETILPTSKEEELSARIKEKQSACKDEDFVQLRSDCTQLIGMCTSGLALRMTNQQFSLLRGENVMEHIIRMSNVMPCSFRGAKSLSLLALAM